MYKGMKLKDLKTLINDIPEELDDCIVIMQRDSEGNGYSPLMGVDENCIYVPETVYSGEVYDLSNSSDDVLMEDKDWDYLKKDPKNRCIVLYPMN